MKRERKLHLEANVVRLLKIKRNRTKFILFRAFICPDYTPGNVGGHHNDEALCSFNKMAAAATALFSSTEAAEAAAACAATSEAVEFM